MPTKATEPKDAITEEITITKDNAEAIIGKLLDGVLEERNGNLDEKLNEIRADFANLIRSTVDEIAPAIAAERNGPFDPNRYLTKVSGSDYLEVKWRLLWMRSEHPDAFIETEMVTHDGQFAVFKARVTIPGAGSATGWGSEQYGDFRDYIEKAETKALGRALAALGFGTQFTKEFEFGAAENRVVDSPVDRSNQQGEFRANPDRPSSPKQHGFIAGLLEAKAGLAKGAMAKEQVDLIVAERFAEKGYTQLPQLNQLEASDWINELNNKSAQEQTNQNRPPRPDIPSGDKAPVQSTPAKVNYDEIDPTLTGESGVPFAQLRVDLKFDKPVGEQIAEWRANVALDNDPELPEQTVRENCRAMAVLAYDAVKVDPAQAWRFAELAKGCRYAATLDGLEIGAQRCGALNSFVVAAIASRRRQLAALA